MRGALAVFVAGIVAFAAACARADDASAPAPELPARSAVMPEAGVDTLPSGDPRRPELLLDLALLRHREADALEREERRAHAEAVASWREAQRAGDGGVPSAPPPLATPRADAQRAEAVRLAQRALDEAPEFAAAPQALLVAGIDSERIGRRKEAARMLGALVRGFPASPHAAEAWLALGEHHLRERDLTSARAAFQSAARSGSSAVRAWSEARLAEVAIAANDGEGALDALGRALAARSARGLAVLDRLAAAPEALAADRDALASLADLCERSGDLTSALALRARLAGQARRGSEAKPRREEPRGRGASLAARGPDGVPGDARLRASAKPAPADRRSELRLEAFAGDGSAIHALGLAALDAGRAAEARALFERALASGVSGEELAPLQNDLGVALFAVGDRVAARVEVTRAAEQDPGLAAAHDNLRALAPSSEMASPAP